LAKIGSVKEVENSLHRLRGKDADVSDEAAEIQVYFINISNLNIISILSL
jgi:SP family facilitated glucose transporter-like MFS transporter 8